MNFSYLSNIPRLKKLNEFCTEAESFVLSSPSVSATSARKAMEYIVKLMYKSLTGSYEGVTVFEMLTDPVFTGFVNDDSLMNAFHYIRKMGNAAVHDGDIKRQESFLVLRELHFIVGEVCILVGAIKDYPPFVAPTSSAPAPAQTSKPVSPAKPAVSQTIVQTNKPAEQPQKVVVEPEVVAEFAPRMRNVRFDVKHKRDEDENKKLYLAASLREAGWPLVTVKNQAMPCSVGLNIMLDDGDEVDYVLYGRDNKPLAIVEYTTTVKNLIEGRMKGIEKADKMAVKLGYKPVVYYTNGYMIYVIDQLGYSPRRVFQYHTIRELEVLKLRATLRKDITNPVIDDNITNRDYQKEAIRKACEAYSNYRRHSLLVMATGTGKTRVSISLVDVLMKAGWINSVLFLADRTSLVRQAHKNFNKLLPSVTTSIYTGSSGDRDPNARMIFSTYQTMIRLIDDDTREFSMGRFDLVIIDEAHRSIFKKYGVLFKYFDSLMLGLTATPRSEENKNTYDMFKLRDGEPDFAYELEQAIEDKFLVGFSVLDRTTDTLRRGIHYDDLTDEQKERFEEEFASGDEDGEERDFSGSVIDARDVRSRNIINLGTIDTMLSDLMKNGLKINSGDKLGKTIIFASSHFEAEKIVERFNHLYSHLGKDFCKLIDSQVENNLLLIDNFGERENLPQVAVSVDMMDTGIDVPDVLNLVFFKQVRSKIKFLQMVGRGTRLCPNVYGPTLDKQGFLIFDYYDNFRYFSVRDTWRVVNSTRNGRGMNMTKISVLINERKLAILRTLNDTPNLSSYDNDYKLKLRDYFCNTTRMLCNDELEVQYNMSYVNKYRTMEQWYSLPQTKKDEIENHIIPLFPATTEPPKVKSFDLAIYIIEDEVPKRMTEGKDIRKVRKGFGNVATHINHMLEELMKLKNIPAITAKESLILKMKDADLLFDDFSLEKCETVRNELRDLMGFIPDDVRYHVIDADDYLIGDDDDQSGGPYKSYTEKAREYIETGSPALTKLRFLDELTEEEKTELEEVFKSKLGSEAEYAAWSNNAPLLPFLRLLVGIADEAIETKFGSFLNSEVLNEMQLTYMRQIISYARENGDIAFLDLQRVSPFCDVDVTELFGENIRYIKTLINGLHHPVM